MSAFLLRERGLGIGGDFGCVWGGAAEMLAGVEKWADIAESGG